MVTTETGADADTNADAGSDAGSGSGDEVVDNNDIQEELAEA